MTSRFLRPRGRIGAGGHCFRGSRFSTGVAGVTLRPVSAASKARQRAGHQYVWAFERPDTARAAEAAVPVERAFARVEDAEAALAASWTALHAVGVLELRLCDRLRVLKVVHLPLRHGE
jgi:hypothetical protein